jgi:Tfp pilus assembly protein PilO
MNRTLRSPIVLISVGAAVVIVLVWLFAFFLPQGKKLNTLTTQQVQLQQEQAALNAQLAQLKKTSAATPQLLALQASFNVAVPPSANTYAYITTMYETTKAAGVTLTSITTGSPGAPSGGISPISVSLSTSGTYDQALKLIDLLNKLPRLTIINAVSMTGGGPNTTRSTSMTQSFSLTIFTTNTVK